MEGVGENKKELPESYLLPTSVDAVSTWATITSPFYSSGAAESTASGILHLRLRLLSLHENP